MPRHRLRRRYGRSAGAGWTVSYFEPTYGTLRFNVSTPAELAEVKEWLHAGGYSYKVAARA
jgi:hypothetical protein